MTTFQSEMRMLSKKNCTLDEKVQQHSCQKNIKKSKAYCEKTKQAFSAEMENRLFEYNNTTKLLVIKIQNIDNKNLSKILGKTTC